MTRKLNYEAGNFAGRQLEFRCQIVSNHHHLKNGLVPMHNGQKIHGIVQKHSNGSLKVSRSRNKIVNFFQKMNLFFYPDDSEIPLRRLKRLIFPGQGPGARATTRCARAMGKGHKSGK